jgi:arginine/lysine/histidine transporter system substrate-binding protein
MNKRTVAILISFIFVSIAVFYIIRKKEAPVRAQADTILIGTNAEFPPFSFISQDQIVGFDIDIAKEVAKRLHKKTEFHNMSFEALIPEIQLGNIHVIAAGMTPTEERSKRVFFTDPHFSGDPLVIVQLKDHEPITTSEDLKNKTVIVNQGYTSDRYISGISGVETIRISSPLISNGILTLKGSNADAYIASLSSLQPYFMRLPFLKNILIYFMKYKVSLLI